MSDIEEIKHGLQLITAHYGFANYPIERCKALEHLLVGKVEVEEIYGKGIILAARQWQTQEKYKSDRTKWFINFILPV